MPIVRSGQAQRESVLVTPAIRRTDWSKDGQVSSHAGLPQDHEGFGLAGVSRFRRWSVGTHERPRALTMSGQG